MSLGELIDSRDTDLVVLDVRERDAYATGHV
jgi:rhodanese-related sulfurtransferase